MKKIMALSVVALMAVLFSCSGGQLQRQLCEEACKTARNNCKEDAQKIRYRTKRAAKLATCELTYDQCMKKCAE
jgi:hypothetical protein